MTVKEPKDKKWVECGFVRRPRGLRGDLVVEWNNGGCPIKLGGELAVSFRGSKEKKIYRVEYAKDERHVCIIRFEGISDRTSADKFKGAALFVPEDSLPDLAQGEYYSYQILGLDVFSESGNLLGKVAKIFSAGENDVYEIMPSGGKNGEEILIPAIADFVSAIDLVNKKIVVKW